ncbi:MAG: OmpH family outer membrane protein [Chitinophagales bacterium]|nr:OmpH family outer membrane protein [Chitinophagales bacterium]
MKFLSYLAVVLLLLTAVSTQAQSLKFGHINSADLLAMMPEIKKADSVLQAYQKSLEDANTSMLTDYQKKIQDFQSLPATTTDAVKEIKQQEIKDLENRIQQFQGGAQDKLQNKKEEVYSPILKKAEDAIKEVAKANNYAYVFDTSAGAVVYAQESDNLMELVKKKLMLK